MNSSASSAVSPFSTASLWAALAGAGGGLLSFFSGEVMNSMTGLLENDANLGTLLLGSGLWSAVIGLTIGAAILIYDNIGSLRGQWHRDLLGGLPLFFGLSFVGGIAGQLSYSIIQNSLTRGIGWALMGAGVGVGIGLLRRDMTQASRGAMGGALGGFIGGFIFDALTLVSSAGSGAFSRLIGQIIMGALVALLMRVVQDALKEAWLLGISTGPYEGKEYPLNTARVTVGREDSNNIALYRERDLPAQLGALVFQNGTWFWQGNPVLINGVPQNNAALNPGDTLQLGATNFRFKVKNPAPNPYPAPQYPAPISHPSAYTAPPPQTVAGWAPPPVPTPTPAPTIAATPAFALMALSGQLVRLPDLSSPVSLGRTAGNQVVLPDAGVSSSHARLQIVNGALAITDLSSTNGTFVNGTKLTPQVQHILSVGDRIRLGQLEYTLRAV